MVFRKPKAQPGFADLKGILAQSKKTDNPLYHTVEILIDRLSQFQDVTTTSIGQLHTGLGQVISGGGGGGGTNGGTPATDAKYYDAPLTDGHMTETDLIFANGECIIVQVPV